MNSFYKIALRLFMPFSIILVFSCSPKGILYSPNHNSVTKVFAPRLGGNISTIQEIETWLKKKFKNEKVLIVNYNSVKPKRKLIIDSFNFIPENNVYNYTFNDKSDLELFDQLVIFNKLNKKEFFTKSLIKSYRNFAMKDLLDFYISNTSYDNTLVFNRIDPLYKNQIDDYIIDNTGSFQGHVNLCQKITYFRFSEKLALKALNQVNSPENAITYFELFYKFPNLIEKALEKGLENARTIPDYAKIYNKFLHTNFSNYSYRARLRAKFELNSKFSYSQFIQLFGKDNIFDKDLIVDLNSNFNQYEKLELLSDMEEYYYNINLSPKETKSITYIIPSNTIPVFTLTGDYTKIESVDFDDPINSIDINSLIDIVKEGNSQRVNKTRIGNGRYLLEASIQSELRLVNDLYNKFEVYYLKKSSNDRIVTITFKNHNSLNSSSFSLHFFKGPDNVDFIKPENFNPGYSDRSGRLFELSALMEQSRNRTYWDYRKYLLIDLLYDYNLLYTYTSKEVLENGYFRAIK